MSRAAKPFRAGQMSMILIGLLITMVAALIAGSVFAASLILKKSQDATHAQIDAAISAGDSTRLEQLKQYLANNADGISQTEDVTAGLGQYDQNKIVGTLSGYAAKAGVTISSFDFGTGATPLPGAAPVNTAGSVNLSFSDTVPYKNFIVFLRLIEQGLMPAQITSGQISADQTNPSNIAVSGLAIKVAQ